MPCSSLVSQMDSAQDCGFQGQEQASVHKSVYSYGQGQVPNFITESQSLNTIKNMNPFLPT
jgi:hypothetical protein